ncbi:cupin domain-containing protein [Dyadobacter bucti]|uniref:cupin domain-containing protein n=1 Tax=Dyadobacter bucti TaxID=2572203 RepID=UPI0011083341|nr:cupin domain-containing protein [Dyadobacter bucti]
MMITKRDMIVAGLAACLTMTGMIAGSKVAVMDSAIFSWDDIPVKTTKTGAVRTFFRSQTATLDELECHVTTLNPGQESHPPHKHPEEEILIIKEGMAEALVNGQMQKVGPGSVIFQAANQMHSIRNAGDVPTTYHVFSWHSPGTMKK